MPAVVPTVLPEDAPESFRVAVAALRLVDVRKELLVREVPGPARIAPYSFALSLELLLDDDEVATGRFVVLHDPDGQQAWEGNTRIVVFVRADLDADMAGDGLLGEVTWSWLQEALAAHGATQHAAGGTVTLTTSSRYGAMAGVPPVHEVELRCSWTPDHPELGAHLLAYADLVASMAGLPPSIPGVVPLSRRRGRG